MRLDLSLEDQFCRKSIRNYILSEIESSLGKVSFHLALGFNEALNNAYEHGFLKSSIKKIQIRVRILNKKTIIRIKNWGESFPGNEVLRSMPDVDEMMEELKDSPRGRGIAVMKEILDKVIYSRDGREILICKLHEEGA